MTDNQLQKLKRAELLDLLLEIEQENEALAEENRSLREQLNGKELNVAEAGSLAEAALRVSGVFEAAQQAADTYLENTRRLCEEREAASLERAKRTEESCRALAKATAQLCRRALEQPERYADEVEKTIASLRKAEKGKAD